MPNHRSNHVQKNRPEQRDYRKGIKNASGTPTIVSESLFSPTDQPDVNDDFPNSGKRPSAWQQNLFKHIKDNRIPWACTVVLSILCWYAINARIQFNNIDGKLENHSKTLDSQDAFIDKQRDLNSNQSLAINETRTLLSTIQAALAEIKADIREMRKPTGKE